MKTFFAYITISALATVLFVSSAMAVPAGRTLTWKAGSSIVTFNGTIHANKGYSCKDCHPAMFLMKKTSGKMKMGEISSGKYCGECHDGKKAFSAKKIDECVKCHAW